MTAGFRIGQGYDVHAFGGGDHVVLGGVHIQHLRGIQAHSDGDVLIHAVMDALLGAAALGDIGHHFPDDDPKHKDADSRVLLREVRTKLTAAGFTVVNVDATVICEAPRISPHTEAMRGNISADLGIGIGAVSVKATTNEKLGPIGRGEGIAVIAVALLAAG